MKKINLDDLNDLISKNFEEDRAIVKEQYENLREFIKDSPVERYILLGDTLAKLSDLILRQSNQVIEVMKVVSKNSPTEDEDWNDSDLEEIYGEIENQKKEGLKLVE